MAGLAGMMFDILDIFKNTCLWGIRFCFSQWDYGKGGEKVKGENKDLFLKGHCSMKDKISMP